MYSELLDLIYQDDLLDENLQVKLFSKYTNIDLHRHIISFQDLDPDWYVDKDNLNLLVETDLTLANEILKIYVRMDKSLDEIKNLLNKNGLELLEYNNEFKIFEFTKVEKKEYDFLRKFIELVFDKELYVRFTNETGWDDTGLEYLLNDELVKGQYFTVLDYYDQNGFNLEVYEELRVQLKYKDKNALKKFIELTLDIYNMLDENTINIIRYRGWSLMQTSAGKYKLVKGDVIGKGSHCTVIALEDTKVIKVLNSDLLKEENALKRIEEEYNILKKLSGHENIIKVFDRKDNFSYTMERAKTSLSNIDNLSDEKKQKIFLAVLNGMEYAHENEVIHRDLHSGNILILTDGRVVISDFGVAKDYTSKTLNTYSVAGGNHKYVAPEGLTNMKKLNKLSDVYSLGVILRDDLKLGDKYLSLIQTSTSYNASDRYSSVGSMKNEFLRLSQSKTEQNPIRKLLSMDDVYLIQYVKLNVNNYRTFIDYCINNKLFYEVYSIIERSFLNNIGYNQWHEYDIWDSFMYEVAVNNIIRYEIRKKAFANEKANHGNRFNNPYNTGKFSSDIMLEFN